MANNPSGFLKTATVCILFSLMIGLISPSAAQEEKEFDCNVFGSGFTPHPENPSICCYPGTVPLAGLRCGEPENEEQPVLRATPSDGQGTSDQCIATGQICVIGGISCCAGSCSGSFPNTYCQ